MPTLRKRKTTEQEQKETVKKDSSNSSSKRQKVSPKQQACTCENHPEPSWSICPVRVLCSNSVAFSAFFSQYRTQNPTYSNGYVVQTDPPYDCRQVQALATLEDKPQYFLCESLLSKFSYQLQGPFCSIDGVITAFRKVFTERTGCKWERRDGNISEEIDHYCYIDYEPAEMHRKGVLRTKAWKFVDQKNAFVPISSKNNQEAEDDDDLEVFYRYIKENSIKKQIQLRNPIFTGTKLSESTLEKAENQIKQLQTLLEKKKKSLISPVNCVAKFGALLPPLGYNQILMGALGRMALSTHLCERLYSLLNFFKEQKEPHTEIKLRLENLGEWGHPLKGQLSYLEASEKEFQLIERYLNNSASCKKQMLVIEGIYGIQNEFESARFLKYEKTCRNRKLLWHGTSANNVRSILSQGLIINPNGYERGIYFADMASKSLGFCKHFPKGCYGMFLCEVALGERFVPGFPKHIALQQLDAWHYLHDGWCHPDEFENVELEDGAILPVGKSTCQKYEIPSKHQCIQSEYIIMKEEQIRLRYLVLCRNKK